MLYCSTFIFSLWRRMLGNVRMAPMAKRKRDSPGNKSTPKMAGSGMKQLKKARKKVKAAESLPTETSIEKDISNNKLLIDATSEDVTESVPTTVVNKKPCSWLKLDKLDLLTGSKSPVQNSKQGKDAKGQNSQRGKEANAQNSKQGKETNQNSKQGNEANVQNSRQGKEKNFYSEDHTKNGNEMNDEGGKNFDKKRVDSRYQRKEKGIANERQEDMKKRDEEADKSIGGLIFMCNAKTKPDCFGYQVMGVPANKKEVVMGIIPGLTLFLYDYDFKLMYGVYKASSAGGMKLEPAAFNGGFPAQVRFTVHKDCLPLPESLFKKALKDSYDERTHKFKTELTMTQVRHLTELFHPTPCLQPGGPSLVQNCDSALLHEESIKRQQRYLNNYDSTPLHHDNNNIPGFHPSSSTVPPREPLYLTEQEYRNYGLRHESRSLPRIQEPSKFGQSGQQKEVVQRFLSEQDYHIYGLRGAQQQHVQNASIPTIASNGVCDPYDASTTSLVNRYLSLPMRMALPSEPYPVSGREPCINDMYHAAHMRNRTERTVVDGGRGLTSYEQSEQPYSFYGSGEPSEFNQGIRLQSETDLSSQPVSRRYSFAG